jgi:hypothetical protein
MHVCPAAAGKLVKKGVAAAEQHESPALAPGSLARSARADSSLIGSVKSALNSGWNQMWHGAPRDSQILEQGADGQVRM